MPKISICVPIYNMDNAEYFLQRNLASIAAQTFKDYEIIVSDDSEDDYLKILISKFDLPIRYFRNEKHSMANNSNNALNQAQSDLVKILYQDDYFYETTSLETIVDHFTPTCWWLATGCTHSIDGVNTFNDHKPYYTESDNTIGSPSVITMRREVPIRFDPTFHWVLDLDLYRQLYRKYGKPKIYDQINVVIGVGTHQETSKLSDERKELEHKLLKLKYEQSTKT